MVAVSIGAAAKGTVAAGAGSAQAVCVAKGIGMSIVLGAGAWGLVIFGVIATAAVYDYIVREEGVKRKTSVSSLRSAVKTAFPAG